MSYQITVKISDQVTALITYHFPMPVKCSQVNYSNDFTVLNGAASETVSKLDLHKYFEILHKKEIRIRAKISNVIFLQARYKREALQLHGYELAAIQAALDAIPPMQFDTPAALQDYCTIYDY